MLSVDQLVRTRATVEVDLGDGRIISLRALTAADTDHVEAARPRPKPPRRKDPTRGSLAPPIADEDDPDYLAASAEWSRVQRAALLAAAMDLAVPRAGEAPGPGEAFAQVRDGPRELLAAWCTRASEVLRGVLTAGELLRLDLELARLTGLSDDALKAALGNS